jgi:hypothetical protein
MDVKSPEKHRAPSQGNERAAQVERENPLWIVMYGDFSMQYTAFPRFRAPSGLVISDWNPGALAARLRLKQAECGYSGHGGRWSEGSQ